MATTMILTDKVRHLAKCYVLRSCRITKQREATFLRLTPQGRFRVKYPSGVEECIPPKRVTFVGGHHS